MKPLIISLIFFLQFAYADVEVERYKEVTKNFVEHYNNDDYNQIFLMFSEEMKKALPIETTIQFLKGINSEAGKINNWEFVKYERSTYASYKATFEKSLLLINISIDDSSNINGLYVTPYIEDNEAADIKNNLSTSNLISENEQAVIFENVKIFPESTQLSIALIKNGKINYYGIIRNKDEISNIDNYSCIFEIGSISKVFTSTLLANSVLNGNLKLSDNINDYLEIEIKNNTKISFLELANHSSGLPKLPTNLNLLLVNPLNPYKDYGEKELEEYLNKSVELSDKGSYKYSNTGTGLLGFTLSKIENKNYEELLQKYIFSKYNMANTSSNLNNINERLVKGLNNDGDQVPNWEFKALAGAGSILSTAEDLSKFALAQFDNNNKELNLTRKKTLTVNTKMDIGLGWHLLKSKSQNIWYWHNGGTGGYTSSMVIDPVAQNGVIILSNVSAFNPNMGNIDKLCFELMKSLE